MGRRFDGQGRSGTDGASGSGTGRASDSDTGGAPRSAWLVGVAACLCAVVAIAGCGGSSDKSSAKVAAATTTATTPTGPTTPTTSTTTSTAAKPPAAKSTTTPTPTQSSKSAKSEQGFNKIKVTSTAFKAGGPIAAKYTCDGAGTSPPLQWQGVPRGTSEVLLLAIDLSGSANDAIQWAVAGISPNAAGIPEGGLPAGAVAGVNSAGKVGWGGICGAKGHLHHVGFLLYALKHKLGLKSGFNPVEVRGGLKGSTLATGLTLATYQRP